MLNQAGRLAKPALFLCDRDELSQQALGKLRNVLKDAARTVTSDRGENSARNARIQIATYQTLGLDDDAKDVASFLTRHYPEPNSFSVIIIIIDECHRSAWNRWRVVPERNPDAIQIGLTATPRELREPKRLRREAGNLDGFRSIWVEQRERAGLIQHLRDGPMRRVRANG
jgi:type I restriction enzyme R subunit